MAAMPLMRVAALMIEALAELILRATQAPMALKKLGVALADRATGTGIGAGMFQFASGRQTAKGSCRLREGEARYARDDEY
jgi:hypothetical protein